MLLGGGTGRAHGECDLGCCLGRWTGVRNPKVQSIFLDDMPIHQAAFCVERHPCAPRSLQAP